MCRLYSEAVYVYAFAEFESKKKYNSSCAWSLFAARCLYRDGMLAFGGISKMS